MGDELLKGHVDDTVTPRKAYTQTGQKRYCDVPGDLLPLREAEFGELDAMLFRGVYLPAAVGQEALDEEARSVEEQMASLRLVDPGPVIVVIRGKVC